MKAWIVWSVNDTWQALVFAETRSKARWLTASHYGSDTFDEASCFRARRCPKMDARADRPRVVEDESMLIESGQFRVCDDCGRLIDEDSFCSPCWQKYREANAR